MSIIVKGMDMPTNCTDCPLNHNQMACRVTGTRWWSDTMVLMNFDSDKERLHDCPLIELPPHGRLGDLDALYEEISNGNKAYNGIEGYDGEYPNIANVDDCLEAIKYADTVIEAEGET